MGRTTRDRQRDSGGELPGDAGLWTNPRMVGAGEDPMAWTVPLLRLGTLRIRTHVLAIVWLAAELFAWVPKENLGLIHVCAAVTAIAVIAVLREAGRAWLGRALGAEIETAVVWPLGGLTGTPQGAISRPLLAECGGLLAGLALAPVLAGLVLWSGVEAGALLFEPLSPRIEAARLTSVVQVWAWWAFYSNAVILLANALLPMSPLDAGRIFLAWERVRTLHGPGSYLGGGLLTGAGTAALRLGLLTGLVTFVIGASAGETRLMALGAFGAFATYLEYRRAEFVREVGEADAPALELPLDEPEPSPAKPEDVAPVARTPGLDDVLRKISTHGMDSLDDAEREVLRRETARRRQR